MFFVYIIHFFSISAQKGLISFNRCSHVQKSINQLINEISKVKISTEFYQNEEVHVNCERNGIGNYKLCNVIDGYLTCSRSECGGDAFRCVCHAFTDMGG